MDDEAQYKSDFLNTITTVFNERKGTVYVSTLEDLLASVAEGKRTELLSDERLLRVQPLPGGRYKCEEMKIVLHDLGSIDAVREWVTRGVPLPVLTDSPNSVVC